MTKLRRLDPQPADLTTHKGPFVDVHGRPGRLICSDRKQSMYPLVFVAGDFESAIVETRISGHDKNRQLIFAAEEIPEPLVYYHLLKPSGSRCSPFYVEQEAIDYAKKNGGRIQRMVQDISYGRGG